ncbi:hypothetical protein EDD85DRAFT_844279, partial [Armillaria nabsnona]
MQLKLAILASVVASSHAAIVGTYYCTQANFTGPCTYTSAESGTCITFSAGGFWNNAMKSMRPDTGVACTLYNAGNCTGTTFPVKASLGTCRNMRESSSNPAIRHA